MKIATKAVTRCCAAALLVLGTSALAQQTPPRLPSPAVPAVPRPAAPTPVQQTPLEVPQRTTATYGDWVVQCEARAGSAGEICDMAQVTQLQGKNIPFSRVAIARPEKGQPVKLIVQLPVNVSFATAVKIQTADEEAGVQAPFANCNPNGCFAEFALKDDALHKLRAATKAGKLSFADAGGHDVVVPVSFNGFAQAFDALSKK